MTLVNARSCGVSVAYLMVTLPLISAPMSSVLAQPSNVAIQPGYSMKAVATGLNFPTAMTFHGDTIWVTEEGTATSPPAVKQIDNKGNVSTQLTATQLPAGTLVSPLTGIVFNRGWFWLVHRQKKRPWSASRRDFAIQAKRSGRDLSNCDRRLSIFWRSSELADRLRCRWPRVHKWGRADQLQRRRA